MAFLRDSSRSTETAHPWTETLNKLFTDLKNRNDETRIKAGKQISNFVASQSRDVSADVFVKFMTDVYGRISNLVHSNVVSDKGSAVVAIDELIEVEFDDNENANKISKFGTFLRVALNAPDISILLHASQALGRLVRTGSNLPEFSETIDVELLSKALEWLKQTERFEPRRYAAVLVLKELAINAPTLFNVHVSAFVDLVWVGLTDQSLMIREAAVEALRACLDVIAERGNTLKSQWYGKLYAEAQKQKDNTPAAHASLLVIGELLVNTGDFLEEHFKEVCDVVFERKESNQKLVKKAVIVLLPRLAAFSSIFVKDYLNASINFLLTLLRKETERPTAYLALGELSVAVRGAIKPFLESILGVIKQGLLTKKKAEFCGEALVCIGMLAIAVGPALRSYMEDLLPEMFNGGLSETLTQSLTTLAKNIPAIMPSIQEHLLNFLSAVLGHKPFSEPDGTARTKRTMSVGMLAAPPDAATAAKKNEVTFDGNDVSLALKTLGTFEFKTNTNVKSFETFLEDLVRDTVVKYLDSDNAVIRKEAARTCAKLVTGNSPRSEFIMGEILEKLLIAGITDRDSSIRKTVLESLEDKKFDKLLAQPENLRSLFMALNDEVFQVRELSIQVIGRLTLRNPAYVMPSLRKTLIQLLGDLQFSGDSRKKEESAKLLSHLIHASHRLLKPYVEMIANVLLPKLKEENPHVASCALAALGELSAAGGADMKPYLHQLVPLIISTLQDMSSTAKREVALVTLGKLASNSGFIITTFKDYPQLMEVLLHIVKTESNKQIRREVTKVLGILGALDPYKYKMNQLKLKGNKEEGATGKQEAEIEETKSGESSSEKYYPTVVISALVRIMRDSSLGSHYRSVIDALMPILKGMGIKGAPTYLPHVMPPYIQIMRQCDPTFRAWLFQELGVLVSIVKYHIRDFLPEIFKLIKENWGTTALSQIITLVEDISQELKEEFKVYLPDLIPPMLRVLHGRHQITKKILHALETFGPILKDYLHLVIPAIVSLFESEEYNSEVEYTKLALNTIARLAKNLNVSDYASRIIHPIVRLLDVPTPDPKAKEQYTAVTELRKEVLETLCSLVYQLGSDYAIFIPMVNKVLLKHNISDTKYETLMARLMKSQPLTSEDIDVDMDGNQSGHNSRRNSDAEAAQAQQVSLMATVSGVKLKVNVGNLKQLWEASQRSTKEDWAEWVRRFSVGLLRESPSPSLRGCLTLAQDYFPLVRELFNAAFISCWRELDESAKADLINNLEKALSSTNMEILQTLLNLAEFMEHEDEPLPLKNLGFLAEKCHAYAKALYYKEEEFLQQPHTNTVESLISLNNALGQPRAAEGILKFAQEQHNIELKETWLEKLHRWDEALQSYTKKMSTQKTPDIVLGRLNCLYALGDWEQLEKLSEENWSAEDNKFNQTIAPMASAAAWNMANWEAMEKFVEVIEPASIDGNFYRAILGIHKEEFTAAQKFIDESRHLLDTELSALVAESYDRAYRSVLKVQQLAELEEVIYYKQSADYMERREMIKKIWSERLFGSQRSVETWQDILAVRTLVLTHKEDMKNWLKFASLCRRSGRVNLAGKVLRNLLSNNNTNIDSLLASGTVEPAAAFGYIKHLWANPKTQQEAFNQLKTFAPLIKNDPMLKARAYQKLGEWQRLLEPIDSNSVSRILSSFKIATELDTNWYKAWHSLALVNFEMVTQSEKSNAESKKSAHLIPAINGFFKSIALSPAQSLQDTLRLLTLWFKYGHLKEVEQALSEGFGTVSIDNWLQVIPQIIARISASIPSVRHLIQELLINIGKEHPEALLFPLNVELKSLQSPKRIAAAKTVMENVRRHSAKLVEQAMMVSDELVRVAILWSEMWHEGNVPLLLPLTKKGLEEASRLHFAEHNVSGAIERLSPLHEMLKQGPETLVEMAFQQAHGRDLMEALEWTQRYQKSNQIADINQAWDLYYNVFRQIKQSVSNLTTLELEYVSPKLLAARDLQLAVPGTYRANDPVITIKSFKPTLEVISSKQHPRKLGLIGHEDLRQDERVMQLFGLVNTLLSNEFETSRNHLSIQRYSVIPLAPNSGVVGWVPHCDTLHGLIRSYRDAKKIPYTLEQRILLQMSSDYINLCTLQKVEIFKYALDQTDGMDLKKILWLRSGTAEVWLERRTNFTRSLALMSMVGYILGLGDRHCSNIMVDRQTGKVIHIDFGDCFEVAMLRDKFPEKVPFRLTRMLINAMGVSGIEGNFRSTCESIMRVLRDNKESLMAVLEAFVHDPLISMKFLITNNSKADRQSTATQDKEMTIEEGAESYASAVLKEKIGKSMPDEGESEVPEVLKEKAIFITTRISNKLTGKDFSNQVLDVKQQVERLIKQATDTENLCQAYMGWSPYW